MRTRISIPLAAAAAAAAVAVSIGVAAPASAGPAAGDTLSVATIEPDSLIPGKSTSGQLPLAALFTPLVGLDAKGNLRYLQAQSVRGSNHAKTWTITIRRGWTFHDGEPVTARSYVDAWNYNAYGPHAHPTSGQLANIVGYAALNPSKGKPKTTRLSGLQVLSTTSFRVRLSKPDSQFPYQLTANTWGFLPLPRGAYKDMAAYNEQPIGDGPYRMAGTWRHDESIPMTAYPRYAGPDRPRTPNLVFKIYSNADTAYTDALAGNVDIASVPGDKLGQFKRDFGSRWRLRGGLNVEYLSFPLFDPRWQDKRLRQAISLAIDRAAINKALFGGVYRIADSFLPAATPGGNPHSCRYCRFDPKQAKQLLAQAGGWSGKMVVNYLGGYGIDQEYQAIANQLRQNLGIDVVAQPSPTIAAFYTNLAEKKYRNGPLYGSWGSSFPSALAILAPNFTRGGIAYDGVYYSSPAVDRLIAKGNAASSPKAAVRAYRAAEARIQADFPAVPLFFQELPVVISKRVANVRMDALANPVYGAVTVKG